MKLISLSFIRFNFYLRGNRGKKKHEFRLQVTIYREKKNQIMTLVGWELTTKWKKKHSSNFDRPTVMEILWFLNLISYGNILYNLYSYQIWMVVSRTVILISIHKQNKLAFLFINHKRKKIGGSHTKFVVLQRLQPMRIERCASIAPFTERKNFSSLSYIRK